MLECYLAGNLLGVDLKIEIHEIYRNLRNPIFIND